MKQPSLFTRSPEAIAANITGVVHHFAGDGLTLKDYLHAALKQAPLFYQSPETIIRHIDMVQDFAERGLFTPPSPRRKHSNPASPLGNNRRVAVIAFLLSRPTLLCLADDNFGLREVHQRLVNGPTNSTMLTNKRYAVERELTQHLGHDDSEQPVSTDGFVAGAEAPSEEQAKRFVLRALIRAGFIRGGAMER